jgi:hypothetical protein
VTEDLILGHLYSDPPVRTREQDMLLALFHAGFDGQLTRVEFEQALKDLSRGVSL